MRQSRDWDSRIEFITATAEGHINLSKTFMRQLFNSILNRVISLLKHEGFPEKCISSPVILIRPSEGSLVQGYEDDGLSEVIKFK